MENGSSQGSLHPNPFHSIPSHLFANRRIDTKRNMNQPSCSTRPSADNPRMADSNPDSLVSLLMVADQETLASNNRMFADEQFFHLGPPQTLEEILQAALVLITDDLGSSSDCDRPEDLQALHGHSTTSSGGNKGGLRQ